LSQTPAITQTSFGYCSETRHYFLIPTSSQCMSTPLMTVDLEHHRCFLLFLECFGGILLKKRIATKHHDFDVSPRANTFFSLIHQYYLRMPSTVALLQKDIQPLSALFFLLLHDLVLHLTLFSKRSH
jgi:hypothetical protein